MVIGNLRCCFFLICIRMGEKVGFTKGQRREHLRLFKNDADGDSGTSEMKRNE